jgi:hypothetical protein
LARSAIFFWLTILSVIFLGIYFKGYRDKQPVVRHKEWGHGVEQTADGGYAIVGIMWRSGGGQSYLYLVKTDVLGRKLWSKTFWQGDVNWGNALEQTNDGGYILAGTTWSSQGSNSDVYVIRTDGEGREVWSRVYGGRGRDEGHSISETTEGGYVICGHTDSFGQGDEDVFLIKIDGDGKEVWQRTYGGRGKDEGFSVRQTQDGGYVIAGLTDSFGQGRDDVYLMKTDGGGNLSWSKTFGGKGRDWARSVRQSRDGGYILAGTTWPFEEKHSQVFMIKTDEHGGKIWEKTLGRRYGDYGYAVEQTVDGGYIVVGNTWPSGRIGESKITLVKTDGKGDKVWAKTMGGRGSQYGRGVCQTFDGGYVIAGKTVREGADDDDIYLAKTDEDGSEAWSTTLR